MTDHADAYIVAYCPRCGMESRYSSATAAVTAAESHAAKKGHAVEITMPGMDLRVVEPDARPRGTRGRGGRGRY